MDGSYDKARELYGRLDRPGSRADAALRALVRNDLAVLFVLEGKYDEALQAWRRALSLDLSCLQARLNRDLVRAELELAARRTRPEQALSMGGDSTAGEPKSESPVRVAVLSFLFNWPSTGGGNMHTAGLVTFLKRAEYEVRHFYAHYPDWGIGRVTDALGLTSTGIEFDRASWNLVEIQARYRRAVDEFQPDYVVVTDAWNMKPLLAEAMRGYALLLLYQAQENLCPLNNLRLIGISTAEVEQCHRNQLANPDVCRQCLSERGQNSGALHRAERELARVGTPEYDRLLRRSLHDAAAVLVLNPITAAMIEPYARRVCIVPWGIDAARFPWPAEEAVEADAPAEPVASENALPAPAARGDGTVMEDAKPVATLFMAAVAGEFIKGYHVAHEACRILRETRSDFELVVTFDPPGPGRIDEFTRSVGWCSQTDLPRHYQAADICLVPTIAQDALSITSVEAMAAGIPVIASRIGGLPYTVTDGVNGLLFEPGNPSDLARQIGRLLDDPALRRQMGIAGRRRFEEDFTWEKVIERYWRPLLASIPLKGHQ
jgi:glycosyltransferase involved in cell wall biosynthesis